MTKDQFLGLRRQGFTIEFVNWGEDITASVANFGDATSKTGGRNWSSKKIRVRKVPFGGTVRLSETPSFLADFDAC